MGVVQGRARDPEHTEMNGLLEQIELDRKQIERQWARPFPRMDVILRLLAHIAFCKAKL